MKKVLIVFIFCFIAVFTTFIMTNYKINITIIEDNISALSSKVFGKSVPVYSNEIKVNRLQMKNATYNFDKLDDNQKIMYSAIAYAVKELKSTVDVDNYYSDDTDTISKDVNLVMTAFFNDHPEVFYLDLTYKLYVSKSLVYDRVRIELTYTVENKKDLEEKLQKIEAAMNAYTNSLDNKSDFEKEVYIHDNIARNAKYYDGVTEISEVPEQYHTIYGTFVEKSAVCDGLAKAIQILLDKVDVENIFITGYLNQVPHAWNMVKLDSNWYHLDVTSDKYVKEEDGTTKTVVHTYFNVTDEYIMKTHTIDNQESNPSAIATTYNYYIKTNSYISNVQDFSARIKELVILQSSNNALEFASDVIDVPTKLLNVLYEINFNGYKDSGMNVKMRYYNELDTYTVQKY